MYTKYIQQCIKSRTVYPQIWRYRSSAILLSDTFLPFPVLLFERVLNHANSISLISCCTGFWLGLAHGSFGKKIVGAEVAENLWLVLQTHHFWWHLEQLLSFWGPSSCWPELLRPSNRTPLLGSPVPGMGW